jgi:hypothetical protein
MVICTSMEYPGARYSLLRSDAIQLNAYLKSLATIVFPDASYSKLVTGQEEILIQQESKKRRPLPSMLEGFPWKSRYKTVSWEGWLVNGE